LSAQAQNDQAQQVASGGEPEEVIVIGQRQVLQLRMQVMAAERNVYELFNKFNDEKRFNISCSVDQPTGSRFQMQICVPQFEHAARREHALAYLDNYRTWRDPYTENKHTHPATVPMETRVASQQKAYQSKMRQVAEEHPEFRNALIQFGELRKRFEDATRTGEAASPVEAED
jgi:hypothetical protein